MHDGARHELDDSRVLLPGAVGFGEGIAGTVVGLGGGHGQGVGVLVVVVAFTLQSVETVSGGRAAEVAVQW